MRLSVPTPRSQSTGRFLSTIPRTVLAGALGFALVFTVGAVPVNADDTGTPVVTEQAVLPASEQLPVDGQSSELAPDQETAPTAEPATSQEASPPAEATEEQPAGTPSPVAEQTTETEAEAKPTPPISPVPARSVTTAPAPEGPALSSSPAAAVHSESPAAQPATAPAPTPTPDAPAATDESTASEPETSTDDYTPGAHMGQGLSMAEAAADPNSRMMRQAAPLAASAQWIPAGVPGTDVSGWQADQNHTRSRVNWSGEWSKGARFVYVKATEGNNFRDASRTSHLAGATKVGMLHGAYHFARPNQSDAVSQADYFVKNGGMWKADGKTLPPLLDIENNPYGANCYGLNQYDMVSWIKTFSNRVQATTGRLPMIYTNYYWWVECTGNSTAFANQPLHIAAYMDGPTPCEIEELGGQSPCIPGAWPTYSMWQFSSKGPYGTTPLKAHEGDSNVWNGTLASLKKFATGTTVKRIYGKDRYEVSAAASKTAFRPGVKTAYIASGVVYTDALSGSATAGHTDSPVLLTATHILPDVIRAELVRLKPQRIVILGGSGTVSNSVMGLLKKYSTSVSRISGKDRYVVSAGVSKSTFKIGTETAYIASGAVYTDALSGSALAGHRGGPVLLTAPNVLPDPIRAELKRLKPKRIVIFGGSGTVSNSVMNLLKRYSPSVSRISGADRYDVSASISRPNYWVGTQTVYIASGAVYSDALSGSAVAAHNGSPILLTAPNVLPNTVKAELQRIKPERIVILGGTGTVSNAVLRALQNYAH